ncbi:thioredoxin family protein [Sulfurimonas paralvinellae]|uniref:Thioredoxin family protein n=1 Tax=Sulfurimonas paralvinellae TaxID=317658 RepID=A0A7M1B9P0_9BACT|nr:thioredoxin family protein [Sulfurimonas paralvinellae]QOP46424.1 thioredoxin family protein [Sulfurimonas paralvinellae]
MKKLLLILILITTLFGYETDNWIHDYSKGLKLAQKEQKNIYLFIGADACKFCKIFKEKTLSQKSVMERLHKDYILIYLSRDRHFIPDKFQRYGAPRHYFLDQNGKILFETFGVLEPAGFFTILDEADLNSEN